MEHIQRGPLESRLGPRQNPVQPQRGQSVPQSAQRPAPQFTPLTKPRTEILELHANLFEKHRPMREDGKLRSKNKFCQFHEDYGHEIENCSNLAYDIENLVRSGPLKKYQDRGAGVNQLDASRSQKKKRQYRGASCNTEAEKKAKYDDDVDEDGDYQYDEVTVTISALAKGQTKSSLKNGARILPSRDPVSKSLKKR